MNSSFSTLTKEESTILHHVIEDFASATDFGAVIVDIRGNEASPLYNFSPFCEAMRKHPAFHELCRKCDMYGGLEASKVGRPSIYRCHAGLTDISLPIISKNQLHGFLLIGQIDTDYIHPSIQTIETKWQDYTDLRQARNRVHTLSQDRIASTARLLEKICNYHTDDLHPRDRIIFNVNQEVNSTSNANSNNKEEIRKATHYIQKNITQAITLEEVANHVYLSQYYFSKLFKKEMGVNFITYLNQQRIERAKALLKESSLSIEAIAHNVGFSQPSYFCKIFKNFTASTPAKYRKDYQLAVKH
ncbi:ligand-binding sensor protein/AraC-like DNA-binding protein [Enterococcus sp. PF1-24]|uniref:PocR ligand-binding domain-containing protein n=1 Tax=unclassified Enterococcus TaxID=2608891 RepID=UPI002475A368|nr:MULTISPECIES: PocR ligand-binding domain-containing protein [unclassified Enterococcus]MDH6365461.1 ligand-binding sensor protein/AraC-like DNA-binding protein [Enterococcus sp. PFB1-1]MDH6402562.1 ligand-binding sensor protein/AraC-like DNA-binding protein [Enterococcus sp. PF1-24]